MGSDSGSTDGPSEPENHLTIEQLAARTGLSVRNLRSHRTNGLLPPPEVRDSVGFYGREHVERLRLIRELQAEGFNLKGIRRLVDERRPTSGQLLGLRRALGAPFEEEEARIIEARELTERLGDQAGPEALERAIELGALIPVDAGRYEMPSPSMLDLAATLVQRGIALPEALELLARTSRRCEEIARDFVDAFRREVWRPFEEAGFPADEWDHVIETIEGVRPLASEGLLVVFRQTLGAAVDEAFGAEIARAAEHQDG